MTLKEQLLSVFDDENDSECFRYTLQYEDGHTQDFEIKRHNKYKSLKRLFRKHMDDNLFFYSLNAKLIKAELVEKTEIEYQTFANFYKQLKSGN